MELLQCLSGPLTRLALLLALFWRANCSPISTRSIDSIVSVDPSPDAWADIISGIGPLILLVGERVTKQLLRNVRGAADGFSLAAAPLGLLSIVTSLIRCCGIQRLRALIGYELESRAAAAIEMTRVNCGGVHAEIVDGYIVRSLATNPASQATAVSILQGTMGKLADDALLQIQLCKNFDSKKSIKGVPDGIATVNWVLHILSAENGDKISVIKALVHAVDDDFVLGTGDDEIRSFCRSLMMSSEQRIQGSDEKGVDQQNVATSTEMEGISATVQRLDEPEGVILLGETFDAPPVRGKRIGKEYGMNVRVREATSESLKDTVRGRTDAETSDSSSTSHSFPEDSGAQLPWLTFMYTMDAVSEFTTTSIVPKPVAMLLGLTSLLAILAIYILALWQEKWLLSVAWLLLFIGYIGIVLAVISAALLIHSSCACIKLESRSECNPEIWTDGLIESVKNTDSMDTRGSKFMSSRSRSQDMEAVWLRDLTRRRKMAASGVAMGLVMSFISHYLGLRSSRWWVAVAELLVCLVAAIARSAMKNRQEKFSVIEQVRIDKRCTSTGIIQTQKCQIIEKPLWYPEIMDARAYSTISPGHTPTSGENIAWHVAKLCLRDKAISSKILDLTGMRIHIMKDGQQADTCAILVSYTGGLLVSEGLVAPNARLCLAFKTKISDLALPTALLARAIMRQPEWYLENSEISKGLPLGNVYIFSMTSIIDWWSLSEDRNDFGDLQRNLQWCFFLINAAFFISVLSLRERYSLEMEDIEEKHGKLSENNELVAENVVRFFQEWESQS